MTLNISWFLSFSRPLEAVQIYTLFLYCVNFFELDCIYTSELMADTLKYVSLTDSPVGLWRIEADSRYILSCTLVDESPGESCIANHVSNEAGHQLDQYFKGERKIFNLPLKFHSYSNFYVKVWKSLQRIPFGHVTNYSAIARKIKKPRAVRAVGQASSRNPFTVLVPCHRIIGKDGSLTGYAFGLKVKQWLLHHEGAVGVQKKLFV